MNRHLQKIIEEYADDSEIRKRMTSLKKSMKLKWYRSGVIFFPPESSANPIINGEIRFYSFRDDLKMNKYENPWKKHLHKYKYLTGRTYREALRMARPFYMKTAKYELDFLTTFK
jgi:hypothetical protein